MDEPGSWIISEKADGRLVSAFRSDADDVTADGIVKVVGSTPGTAHDRERVLFS